MPGGDGLVQERGGFLHPDSRGGASYYEWPLASACDSVGDTAGEGGNLLAVGGGKRSGLCYSLCRSDRTLQGRTLASFRSLPDCEENKVLRPTPASRVRSPQLHGDFAPGVTHDADFPKISFDLGERPCATVWRSVTRGRIVLATAPIGVDAVLAPTNLTLPSGSWLNVRRSHCMTESRVAEETCCAIR
jgi:hypothetical protein